MPTDWSVGSLFPYFEATNFPGDIGNFGSAEFVHGVLESVDIDGTDNDVLDGRFCFADGGEVVFFVKFGGSIVREVPDNVCHFRHAFSFVLFFCLRFNYSIVLVSRNLRRVAPCPV